MQLSVIIPNFNGSKTIGKCIDSVYNQGIKLHQVLVIDDNSTDNSFKIVNNNYPDVDFISLNTNGGAARARNIGIKKSTGDYLLFIDSDVFLTNECLANLLEDINNYDILYPKVLFEDKAVLSPVSSNEKRFIRRSPSFLIKKEAVMLLDEYFDEEYFIYYEDIDFFMRCYLFGLKSKYIDTAVAYHSIIQVGRDLSRRFYLETRNRIYCYIKFLLSPSVKRKEFLLPGFSTFIETIITVFTNRNIYLKYPDHGNEMNLCESKLRLHYLFWKALIWNIRKLPISIQKQRNIKNYYNKMKDKYCKKLESNDVYKESNIYQHNN